MLLPKRRNELTSEDIRRFCSQFSEGIRVEYKSDLTSSVRSKLPEVISSFANAYGGILIVGVATKDGRPIEPIEGFTKREREELVLTVENICQEHIFPLLSPIVTEVESDVPGKVFIVVDVEPSPQAPHAIENTRKVYIRTGNAKKPIDLADMDTIEKLVRRRENLMQFRQRFEEEASVFIQKFAEPRPEFPKVIVTVGPLHPYRQVLDREAAYRFLRDTHLKGVDYFYCVPTLRRVPRGVCGFRYASRDLGYIDTYGHLCHREVLICDREQESYFKLPALIRPILFALYCASKLYETVVFRGEISVRVRTQDLLGHICAWQHGDTSDEVLRPPVDLIPAELGVSSERLREDIPDIASQLTHQLVWPMGQSYDSITVDQVAKTVDQCFLELLR